MKTIFCLSKYLLSVSPVKTGWPLSSQLDVECRSEWVEIYHLLLYNHVDKVCVYMCHDHDVILEAYKILVFKNAFFW